MSSANNNDHHQHEHHSHQHENNDEDPLHPLSLTSSTSTSTSTSASASTSSTSSSAPPMPTSPLPQRPLTMASSSSMPQPTSTITREWYIDHYRTRRRDEPVPSGAVTGDGPVRDLFNRVHAWNLNRDYNTGGYGGKLAIHGSYTTSAAPRFEVLAVPVILMPSTAQTDSLLETKKNRERTYSFRSFDWAEMALLEPGVVSQSLL